MFGWVLNTPMWEYLKDSYCITTYAVYSSIITFWLVLMLSLIDLKAVEGFPRNGHFFDVLWLYNKKL